MDPEAAAPGSRSKRRPGRPAMYVFNKPDEELSESERRLKSAITKRRERQNRCYHRKRERQKAASAAAAAAATAPALPGDNGLEAEAVAHPPDLSLNPLALSSSLQSRQFQLPVGSPEQDTLQSLAAATSPTLPQLDWGITEPQTTKETTFGLETTSLTVETPPALGEAFLPLAHSPLAVGTDDYRDQQQIARLDAEIDAFEQGLHAATFRAVNEDFQKINRSAALKSAVFDSVRDRYFAMPGASRRALRELSVFPQSFDLAAAGAVIGVSEPTETFAVMNQLEVLFSSSFLKYEGDRLQLNDVARLFVRDPAQNSSPVFTLEMERAKERYVVHYTGILSRLNTSTIHMLGWAREQAMQTFDTDRHNMEYTYFLASQLSKSRLREFMAAGAAIMRFCVGAQTRIAYFENALVEELPATAAPMTTPTSRTTLSLMPEKETEKEISWKARLEIGLGEAYLDTLAPARAQAPISRAFDLLHNRSGNVANTAQVPFTKPVDDCLCLLLLANLRMESGYTDEAHALLVKALKILASRGFGRTTFAVNALSNLVTIYVQKSEIAKAKGVATELLDVLHEMGYSNMPIYADVLGVMATVSMAEGNGREAERQFAAALEVVASWGTKKWADIPVQHCLDLDLWLMQGMGQALAQQGREKESTDMLRLAAQASATRGLETPAITPATFSEPTVTRWRTYTRHIY